MSSKRNKGKWLSKRGFLFTISTIIFASTLLIYAQAYLNHSTAVEKYVSDYSNRSAQPFLNDDVAFDLSRILDFSVSVDYSNEMSFLFSDVVPKRFDLNSKLQDYKSFLEQNFFSHMPGSNSLDLSGINDGSVEIFFGDSFQYTYNYDTNSVAFNPLTGSTLNRIDLNLTVNNVGASAALDSNSFSSSGSIPITINYKDDYNSLAISGTINPAIANNLLLNYKDGSRIEVVLGLVDGISDSFLVDSGTHNILSYTMRVSYNVTDINAMPIEFNASLWQKNAAFESINLLKLRN